MNSRATRFQSRHQFQTTKQGEDVLDFHAFCLYYYYYLIRDIFFAAVQFPSVVDFSLAVPPEWSGIGPVLSRNGDTEPKLWGLVRA